MCALWNSDKGGGVTSHTCGSEATEGQGRHARNISQKLTGKVLSVFQF